MTENEIIDGVIVRETDKFTDHPGDRGGPTKYGITAKTLGVWRALGRQATRAEVQALGRTEAVEIYRHLFVKAPGFLPTRFAYEPLRVQMIDDGVLSGPRTAVQTLQRVLKVPHDGIFGSVTQAALAAAYQPAVHVEYVKARARRLAQLVQDDPSQVTFVEGWIMRALSFLEVPQRGETAM